MIMMNLFSVFDPSTSLNWSFNWLSSLYVLMFFPSIYWFIYSRYEFLFLLILSYLINEFKMLMNKKSNLMSMLIFLSLFILILLNNFLGMFPYVFTSSSHMVMGLTFSLSLWFSFMLFGWIKHSFNMFCHLVPQGSPWILMPFMVLIETVSNLIRPGTLAVRLMANMISGHLLMTLISLMGSHLSMLPLSLMLLGQSILIILELSVSMIQAYVFTVLSALYSAEILN